MTVVVLNGEESERAQERTYLGNFRKSLLLYGIVIKTQERECVGIIQKYYQVFSTIFLFIYLKSIIIEKIRQSIRSK